MRPGVDWYLIERWWNGSYGRLNQKRIWLYSNGRVWRLQARLGDADDSLWEREYEVEADARLQMEAMRRRTSSDPWRQL